LLSWFFSLPRHLIEFITYYTKKNLAMENQALLRLTVRKPPLDLNLAPELQLLFTVHQNPQQLLLTPPKDLSKLKRLLAIPKDPDTKLQLQFPHMVHLKLAAPMSQRQPLLKLQLRVLMDLNRVKLQPQKLAVPLNRMLQQLRLLAILKDLDHNLAL
jgi:hypothetical protein